VSNAGVLSTAELCLIAFIYSLSPKAQETLAVLALVVSSAIFLEVGSRHPSRQIALSAATPRRKIAAYTAV
jgi:hypothetical protein